MFENSTFSTLSGFNRFRLPCALTTLNSLSLATELTGALRYFQAFVAISGSLWHCPIYACNGQPLRLYFGSFKYVATISFALTYGSSD